MTARLAAQKTSLPKPGPDPKFSLPPIEKTKLSNGLNVWVVRQAELPIVSMNLVINSGGTLDPADRSGVSSATANMLNQGTKARSANDISNQLQSIGASVNANAGWDSTNVTMQTLTKNLDKALDIFSDVVTNAAFPNADFENQRRRGLVALLQRKSNPTAVSDVVYNKVLYGEQPYGRQLSGDENKREAMTPRRSDKILRGQLPARERNADSCRRRRKHRRLVPKLEKAFGSWNGVRRGHR